LPSTRRAYLTDLSDDEWSCLKPHLPTPRATGRPPIQSPREILNAIFYITRSGCAWRLLPHDFPPWKTVHHYFRIWRIDGTWERLNTALRERLRARLGRNPYPSAGIVDSESAKTTGVCGEARGYDGGKKVCGRKRHLLVETEGLVLKAKVHSAKVPEQDGIKLLVNGVRDRLPRLSHVWVDAGYQGRGKEWAEQVLGLSVEVVHRTPKPTPE
jgi:putative transposase